MLCTGTYIVPYTYFWKLSAQTEGTWYSRELNCVAFYLTAANLLYSSPIKEIGWHGKRAFSLFVYVHDNGAAKATNGGNFYIAIADKIEPQTKC